MKTACYTSITEQGFGQYFLNVLVAEKMEMKSFLWNYGMFVSYTKKNVKKFYGCKINEIYSGTISCADINVMSHCLTSKTNMQSSLRCKIQHRVLTS